MAGNPNPPIASGIAPEAATPAKGVVDALRLPDSAIMSLHQRLDEAGAKGAQSKGGISNRRWRRWTIRAATAEATIFHPGGSAATCKVAPRTLSAGGMSMLHGGFVHTGTPITVTLHARDGCTHDLKGEVVRCRHIGMHIHELGVRFEKTMDPRLFIAVGHGEDALLFETIDAKSLEGRLLLVYDEGPERRMIAHMLRATRIEIEHCADADDAVRAAGGAYDVVTADQDMAWTSGIQLAVRMRAASVMTPLMLMVSADPASLADVAQKAGVTALFPKPIIERTLHRALAELLLMRPEGARTDRALVSDLSAQPDVAPLIEQFVAEAKALADQLEDCMRTNDRAGADRVCRTLRASGSTYGFQPITLAADQAMTSLKTGSGLSQAATELRRLRDLCRKCAAG